MRRPTSPQDAASRLAVARADYVPDAPKPTTQASHTGLAGVMRDLFDQITELRAQQHLWRHILDLLDRAELAPAGLTAKQLAIAFNHERRLREGRLRRKGKLVAQPRSTAPLPRRLTLGVAQAPDGAVWAMALLDETGAVLIDALVNPDGDYTAYLDSAAAGIEASDLAVAKPVVTVAASLADRLAALALEASVHLVTNDKHWPSTPFGHALFQRCGSTLEAYGAGIKITVAAIDTKAQSAAAIARQIRQPRIGAPSP